MSDPDRWEKVRLIVREECERIEARIIAVLEKHGHKQKTKVELVNGKWEGITPHLQSSWALAYPGVDIPTELNKAAAWIMSNPTLAPKSQFARFLLTWFSRTQDRLSIRSIPTRSEIPKVPSLCEYCLAPSTGSIGGVRYCPQHMTDAMDGRPRPKMPGVVAKAVAGS